MIDEKDWEILAIIQENGRATYGEIGQQVGLAPSSVHDRVRKLEQRGVITGYGPRLDSSKLGYGMVSFVSVATTEACSLLAERFRGWPEVEECHAIAGEECAILKIRTADSDGLYAFLERLRRVPGVERTRSSVVLKTYWDHQTLARPTDSVSPNGR